MILPGDSSETTTIDEDFCKIVLLLPKTNRRYFIRSLSPSNYVSGVVKMYLFGNPSVLCRAIQPADSNLFKPFDNRLLG